MKVKDAYKPLLADEADKMLDEETLVKTAIRTVEEDGIVFLDEVDKITARSDARGGGQVFARRCAARSTPAHRRHDCDNKTRPG